MLLVRASTAPSQDILSSLTCSCLAVLARNTSRAGRQGKRQCRCARTASAGTEAAHSSERTDAASRAMRSQPHKKQDQSGLMQESFTTKAAGERLRQRKTMCGRCSRVEKLLLCEWAKPGWLKVSLTHGAPGMLLGSRQA